MKKKTWLITIGMAVVLTVVLAGSAMADSPPDSTTGGAAIDGTRQAQGYCYGNGTFAQEMLGFGGIQLGSTETLERVAGVLGITYDELVASLENGETIAAIAEAQGVESMLVVDAILEPYVETLQQRVSDGYLTAEEADTILQQTIVRVEEAITTQGLGEDCQFGTGNYDSGQRLQKGARMGSGGQSGQMGQGLKGSGRGGCR